MKYGIIAGNGRFPVLALETARQMGDEAVVIAIREEAAPEIESLAAKCHWVSLGELSRLIDICHQEGITQVMMAIPLQILYEISVWIAWYWERKDRKRAEREALLPHD